MSNISISELKEKTIDELTDVAKGLKVEGAAGLSDGLRVAVAN